MPLPVYWSHGPNKRDQKVRWKVGRETPLFQDLEETPERETGTPHR